GILSRVGIANLGESFTFLGSTPALVAFGAATVFEIVADKVPILDHALDSISTVIRPLAGTLVAAAAFVQIQDPLPALVAGLLAGGRGGLLRHTAKSGGGVLTTTTTAGVGNAAVSTVEDGVAISWTALSFVAPVALALIFVAIVVVVLRRRQRARGRAA